MRSQIAFVFAVLLSASIAAPQAADAQSLTGVVYAPDGAAFAEKDVTLLLRWEPYRAEEKVVRTSADGHYRVDGLAAGPVTVSARTAVGWAALGDLAIGAAGEPVSVDIRLHAGATLEVQVLDMRRQPVPGSEFRLGGPFDAWQQIPCTADGQGRAVTSHLAPGYYMIEGHPWRSGLTLLGPDDHAQVTLFTDPTAKPPSATPAEAAPAPPRTPCPLSGTVSGPDDGPVSAAKVYIDYFPFDNWNFISPQGLTLTDAEGGFAFGNVVPGYHWLTVAREDGPLGFFPFYAPGPEEGRGPVTVTLPRERGGLAGAVIDPLLGTGISKAEVIVAKRAPLGPDFVGKPPTVDVNEATPIGGADGKPADVCWRAESGEDGRFEFAGLLPGDYTVIARAVGAQAALGGVVIEPGGTTSIPPLRLYAKDALKLTGRVTAQEAPEKGLAGTQVSVFTPRTYESATQTVTGADGGLTIPVEQPGWYSLSTMGVAAEPRVYYGAIVRSDGRPTPIDIVLPEGTSGHCTASVRVVLPTGQAPKGRVWVVPLQSYPMIGATRPRPRFDLLAYADDQGACAFDRLPPGRYRLLARTEVTPESGPAPPMQGTSEEVVVSSAAAAEAVTVLESAGRIVGQVTQEDGSAAAGVMVGTSSMILPWQFMPLEHFAVTDETGSFTMEAVEPGACDVSPVAWEPRPDGSPMYMYLESVEAQVAPGQTVPAPVKLTRSIEPTGQTTGPPPVRMTISGTVVYGADGTPAAGVQVSLPNDYRAALPPMVLTDGAGRFRLTVFAGEWSEGVAAYVPGYAESWFDLLGAGIGPDRKEPVEGVELRLGRGGAITGSLVLPDDDPALGDLIVRAPRKVPARMMQAGGMPAGGMGVAYRPGRRGAGVSTEIDGSFRISHLTPGTYELSAAWGTLGRSESVQVEVQEGAQVEGTMVVVPPLIPRTSALVVSTDGVTPIGNAALSLSSDMGPVPADALRTDPAGGFVVHCLPEGTYKVQTEIAGAIRYASRVADLTVEPGEGDVLLMAKQMSTVKGRVVPAPGLTIPPGLRAALTGPGMCPTWAIATAPVNPDGSYTITVAQSFDFDLCLVMGHCTRIAQQKLNVIPGAVTEAPDMEWTGVVPEQ